MHHRSHKFLFTTFIITILLSLPLFAQESTEKTVEPDKITTNEENSGEDNSGETVKKPTGNNPTNRYNGFFEVFGTRGFTYPYGEISGDGGQEAHIAESSSSGINTGYILNNNHIIIMGISYLTQRVEFERQYMNKLMLTSIEAKFLNFDLSYRVQKDWYYFGGGLYFGIPVGTWSRKNALDGEVTENLLYGSEESACKNTAGINLFGGFTFEINERFSLNTGMRLLVPFLPAYEADQDKIYIFDAAVCVSLSRKFQLPF